MGTAEANILVLGPTALGTIYQPNDLRLFKGVAAAVASEGIGPDDLDAIVLYDPFPRWPFRLSVTNTEKAASIAKLPPFNGDAPEVVAGERDSRRTRKRLFKQKYGALALEDPEILEAAARLAANISTPSDIFTYGKRAENILAPLAGPQTLKLLVPGQSFEYNIREAIKTYITDIGAIRGDAPDEKTKHKLYAKLEDNIKGLEPERREALLKAVSHSTTAARFLTKYPEKQKAENRPSPAGWLALAEGLVQIGAAGREDLATLKTWRYLAAKEAIDEAAQRKEETLDRQDTGARSFYFLTGQLKADVPDQAVARFLATLDERKKYKQMFGDSWIIVPGPSTFALASAAEAGEAETLSSVKTQGGIVIGVAYSPSLGTKNPVGDSVGRILDSGVLMREPHDLIISGDSGTTHMQVIGPRDEPFFAFTAPPMVSEAEVYKFLAEWGLSAHYSDPILQMADKGLLNPGASIVTVGENKGSIRVRSYTDTELERRAKGAKRDGNPTTALVFGDRHIGDVHHFSKYAERPEQAAARQVGEFAQAKASGDPEQVEKVARNIRDGEDLSNEENTMRAARMIKHLVEGGMKIKYWFDPGDDLQGAHIEYVGLGYDPARSAKRIDEIVNATDFSDAEKKYLLGNFMRRLGQAIPVSDLTIQQQRFLEVEGGAELTTWLFEHGMENYARAQGQHIGKSGRPRGIITEPALATHGVDQKYWDRIVTVSGAVAESGGRVPLEEYVAFLAHTPVGSGDLSRQIEADQFYDAALGAIGDRHRGSLSIRNRKDPKAGIDSVNIRVLVPGQEGEGDFTNASGYPGSPHGFAVVSFDPTRGKADVTFYLDKSYEKFADPVKLP
ncbi:MAG: hypothetical protein V1820_00595 [archaeon]